MTRSQTTTSEVGVSQSLTVAIDGPAASGKSTIGNLLAERLGYGYLDTGDMYRAVTWAALQDGIGMEDEQAVTEVARGLIIEITTPVVDDGRQSSVSVDGAQVTRELKYPELDRCVSLVSVYPGVRHVLTEQQRRIASQGAVVMVGRDIGTIVIPDADLKIYLDASPEVRARRRYLERVERGEEADYERILSDVVGRDRIDSQREVAPLKAALDAIVVDTDNLSIDEVLDVIEELVEGTTAGSAERAGG